MNKEDASLKNCMKYIKNYVKNHPELDSQYTNDEINETLCSSRYVLTEIDFKRGLIK